MSGRGLGNRPPPRTGDDTGRGRAVREEQQKHVSAIESARERLRSAWRRSQPASARRILVVDDHEPFRSVMLKLLEGYDVRVCGHADEAMAELRAREYDVLIADIDLPGTDGEELVREVRRLSRRPQIPVLIVSGFEDRTALAAIAERIGAVAWFRKPFNLDEFCQKVRELLGNGPVSEGGS